MWRRMCGGGRGAEAEGGWRCEGLVCVFLYVDVPLNYFMRLSN